MANKTESSADQRFATGTLSKVSDVMRSSVVPATLAAGLAGYLYARKRTPSRTEVFDTRSTGERAYDVFTEWGKVNSLERYRPRAILGPSAEQHNTGYAARTWFAGAGTVRPGDVYPTWSPYRPYTLGTAQEGPAIPGALPSGGYGISANADMAPWVSNFAI